VRIGRGPFFVVAFAFVLLACRAPKSDLRPPEVLRFGVGHMSGSYHFVVFEDGHATYEQSGGGKPAKKVETTVTKDELAALAKTLRDHDLCGKRGSGRKAVPDEARPSVAVRLEGLDCRVAMLDGEWRDDEHAQAALAAVEAFGRSLGERDK
jgi:hypothetical protein